MSVSIQANGKKRLILDLRYVNKCLDTKRVKYEDWKVALSYFEQDAYMFSFDLKSGYHHIEIHAEHQTFLGFAWENRSYIFTVLPFGLSTAPYIFTKVLKLLEKYWRHNRISIAVFLDDGWSTERDLAKCIEQSKTVRTDILNAGFIPNDEKSTWTPTKTIVWLVLHWNSERGTLSITQRRIDKIHNALSKIVEAGYVISARDLAKCVGQIISTGAVLGNISRIMTRHCSMSIASASTWDKSFSLDEYCRQEIQFWQRNLTKLNERHCFLFKQPNCFVHSNASFTGCGSVITLNETTICHKMWEPWEREKSSTWRELSAIEFSLRSFTELLKSTHVKWFTDSQAAAKIVEVGSMNFELHVLAINIFTLSINNQITLNIQWIPREENVQADYISKLVDPDDWQITEALFEYLETLWGPHTVDCFANYYNHKLPRFFSRFWNPNTSGVDFFIQKLSNENCLVVPPVSIASRVLHYLFSQKTNATVVLPLWKSANYWPLIASKFRQYITGSQTFTGNKVLTHGKSTNLLLGSSRFHGDIIVLRMTFAEREL